MKAASAAAGGPREVVSTLHAPAAVGPYSQAIRAGGLVFTAGQVGLDPELGKLVSEDLGEQTHRLLQNLQAVLEAAGSSLQSVVKTTVFLTDMTDFAAVNAIYAGYFPSQPPARSTVAVAALPLGARVEIEAVALLA